MFTRFLPSHPLLSALSLNPFLHSQLKLPPVLLQMCSHPALFRLHSLKSARFDVSSWGKQSVRLTANFSSVVGREVSELPACRTFYFRWRFPALRLFGCKNIRQCFDFSRSPQLGNSAFRQFTSRFLYTSRLFYFWLPIDVPLWSIPKENCTIFSSNSLVNRGLSSKILKSSHASLFPAAPWICIKALWPSVYLLE